MQEQRVLSAGPSRDVEKKETFDTKELKNQFKELAESAAAAAAAAEIAAKKG